jgi:hypothetical protein
MESVAFSLSPVSYTHAAALCRVHGAGAGAVLPPAAAQSAAGHSQHKRLRLTRKLQTASQRAAEVRAASAAACA